MKATYIGVRVSPAPCNPPVNASITTKNTPENVRKCRNVRAISPTSEPRSSAKIDSTGPGNSQKIRPNTAAHSTNGLFGFGYVITATFLVVIVRANAAVAHLEPVVWIAVGLSAVPSVALWTALGRRLGVYPAYALACFLEAAGVAG